MRAIFCKPSVVTNGTKAIMDSTTIHLVDVTHDSQKLLVVIFPVKHPMGKLHKHFTTLNHQADSLFIYQCLIWYLRFQS